MDGMRIIDEARLAELAEEIGPDALDEVISMFLDEIAEAADRLSGAGDPARAAEDLHFIKGAAANLGLAALAGTCAEEEARARAGEPLDRERVLAAWQEARSALAARTGAGAVP